MGGPRVAAPRQRLPGRPCARIAGEVGMTVTLDTPKTTFEVEPLTIAGRTFRSRLFLGTGKYPDFPTMSAALGASGTEVVTVALRCVNFGEGGERGQGSLLDF